MANPLDQLTEDQSGYVGNRLTRAVAPQAQPNTIDNVIAGIKRLGELITAPEGFSTGHPGLNQVVEYLTTDAPGRPRLQLWPERMVRSGLTLAGDVMSGREPVIDPETGRTSEHLIERSNDMAGLAVPGALIQKGGTATLGSGPVRRGSNLPTSETPVFYSALEHAATNAAQDTMSPQQWLGWLKNQPGVKGEELAWTGLGDWLGAQKGKVSKADVQRYLDEHKVEVKDVTKSKSKHGDDEDGDWSEHSMDQSEEHASRIMKEEFDKLPTSEKAKYNNDVEEWIQADDRRLDRHGDIAMDWLDEYGDWVGGSSSNGTKYSSYQLPGGENYREHLLTLPPKPQVQAYAIRYKDGPQMGSSYPSRTAAEQELRELFPNRNDLEVVPETPTNDGVRTGTKANPDDYKSPHWDEPNIVAHVRTNDRDVGGVPSLHIEEIQSDWHQAGRKSGYTPKPEEIKRLETEADTARAALEDVYNKMPDRHRPTKDETWSDIERIRKGKDPIYINPDSARNLIDDYRTKFEAHEKATGGNVLTGRRGTVPDAPFKTSWAELALKRMVRMAAEEGKTRVSWTPGEAQAARYDLSKSIDRVLWSPEGEKFMAFDKNGHVIMEQTATAEKLPDIIGKEAADKLINKPTKINDLGKAKQHVLENADLKVGGEGMKGFYDNMLPKMVEKLGKAHGVKVKKDLVPVKEINRTVDDRFSVTGDKRIFNTVEEAKRAASEPVYYFDIPPAWSDQAVSKGFPLFMSGIPFPLTPVDFDPFKKDR